MKLYDCQPAPSPRRVRVFLAEKGIEIPTEQINLRAGEQFLEEFRTINPRCTVPVLETEEGNLITEAMAICVYLEELYPKPVLLGKGAEGKAAVAMWNNIAEMDGLWAMAEAFRNSTPMFKDHALPGPTSYEQLPVLAARGRERVEEFMNRMNQRLEQVEYLAGDDYSVADITLLITVDFSDWIKLDAINNRPALARWHEKVSARDSASA